MTEPMFTALLQKLQSKIEKQDTFFRLAISPAERLSLTLRYLATGESFSSLHFQFKIGKSTISSIIPEVCQAIYDVLKIEYLSVPQTTEDWENIATEFAVRWNFPNCIGWCHRYYLKAYELPWLI